jgi:phage-related protein
MKTATTIEEKWNELPEHLQRFKDMPFPYYDDLDEIYNGIVLSFNFKKYFDDLHEIYTMLLP